MNDFREFLSWDMTINQIFPIGFYLFTEYHLMRAIQDTYFHEYSVPVRDKRPIRPICLCILFLNPKDSPWIPILSSELYCSSVYHHSMAVCQITASFPRGHWNDKFNALYRLFLRARHYQFAFPLTLFQSAWVTHWVQDNARVSYLLVDGQLT
jgi:hypothetical protein